MVDEAWQLLVRHQVRNQPGDNQARAQLNEGRGRVVLATKYPACPPSPTMYHFLTDVLCSAVLLGKVAIAMRIILKKIGRAHV